MGLAVRVDSWLRDEEAACIAESSRIGVKAAPLRPAPLAAGCGPRGPTRPRRARASTHRSTDRMGSSAALSSGPIRNPSSRHSQSHGDGHRGQNVNGIQCGCSAFLVENAEHGVFVQRILCLRPAASQTAMSKLSSFRPSSWTNSTLPQPRPVRGLRATVYSCAEIGSRLGITRQAAHQRWRSSS
jgi:hypothetical protein